MNKRAALVLGLLCAAFAAKAAHAGATEWIDIHIVDGQVYLDSEISGIPGYAVIDTASETNAVNGRFLAAQNLKFKKGRKVKVSGVLAESRHDTYKEIPAKLLGTDVEFKNIIEQDMESTEVQLLLGASFLENYIFQLDLPNSRVRLISHDSVDLKKIQNVESKKNPDGGPPLVRVSLGPSTDAWLTMDTGNNGGIIIDRRLAMRLDGFDSFPKKEVSITAVGREGSMEEFRVPSVKLGEFEIKSPLVWIPARDQTMDIFETDTKVGTRIAERTVSKGLLGYDILRMFVITIDFKNSLVHLFPGETLTPEAVSEN